VDLDVAGVGGGRKRTRKKMRRVLLRVRHAVFGTQWSGRIEDE
jgi:hypothetical protein